MMYEFLDRLVYVVLPELETLKGYQKNHLMMEVIIPLELRNKSFFQKLTMIKSVKFEAWTYQ